MSVMLTVMIERKIGVKAHIFLSILLATQEQTFPGKRSRKESQRILRRVQEKWFVHPNYMSELEINGCVTDTPLSASCARSCISCRVIVERNFLTTGICAGE